MNHFALSFALLKRKQGKWQIILTTMIFFWNIRVAKIPVTKFEILPLELSLNSQMCGNGWKHYGRPFLRTIVRSTIFSSLQPSLLCQVTYVWEARWPNYGSVGLSAKRSGFKRFSGSLSCFRERRLKNSYFASLYPRLYSEKLLRQPANLIQGHM